MNDKSVWQYESHWDDDDGLIECWRHRVTDECITPDEYYSMFGSHE